MHRLSAFFLTFILCTVVLPAEAQADMAHNGEVAARLEPVVANLAWPGRTTSALRAADDEFSEEDEFDESDDADERGAASEIREQDASVEPEQDAESTPTPWVENQNEDYRFVGLRARVIYIPKFMFGLFQADGGVSVLAPSIGPEYVTRRNGFEVDTWLTYASFSMDDAPFKSKSDPDEAYEIVNSEIKTLTVGADFLWTKPLNDKGLSLVYGGGAGIGVVFGDLHRNQSYPENGVPGDPADYLICPRPGGGTGAYCDRDNDHYGDYTEPSWLDGGSKPVLFPWIAIPQVGLRWKPSKQFVLRVDTGLSFPGPFFFGVSGQYGLL